VEDYLTPQRVGRKILRVQACSPSERLSGGASTEDPQPRNRGVKMKAKNLLVKERQDPPPPAAISIPHAPPVSPQTAPAAARAR